MDWLLDKWLINWVIDWPDRFSRLTDIDQGLIDLLKKSSDPRVVIVSSGK